MARPRRTQAERREATIGKLLQATVGCLAELGYAATSTSAICKRAGVSQGGLFRHFGTRLELVAAATEQVGQGQVGAIEQIRGEADELDIAQVVALARDLIRSPPHAAWHEVMVAARTDAELREAVAPVLRDYEAAVHRLARSLLPEDHPDPRSGEVLVLTVLHALDSEAVTRRVHSSPEVEEARLQWAIRTLSAEAGPAPVGTAREAYDAWASTYDAQPNRTRDLDEARMRAEEALFAGASVVELGCGTGKNTAVLGPLCARLVALDVSEAMLARARKRALPDTVAFHRIEPGAPWPVEDASMDGVTANLVLEHVEDLGPFFAECARALKPTGWVRISEIHPARQYRGSQARFVAADGRQASPPCFVHDTSEYLREARAHGFALQVLDEPRADETETPRLVVLRFAR